MEIAVVATKGRIVIPAGIRKRFGIKKGARIGFIERDGKLMLQPLNKDYFLSIAGVLGTKGDLLKSLLREKKLERRREDRRFRYSK